MKARLSNMADAHAASSDKMDKILSMVKELMAIQEKNFKAFTQMLLDITFHWVVGTII